MMSLHCINACSSKAIEMIILLWCRRRSTFKRIHGYRVIHHVKLLNVIKAVFVKMNTEMP